MLKVLLKYHITPQGIRHEDAEFLTNMVIQFANQFVCQVDLNLKLATRRIKFIGESEKIFGPIFGSIFGPIILKPIFGPIISMPLFWANFLVFF